ncbi:MAG TPA: glycosyltransferase family 4 protein [Methylocella sp.]|nr:glycosyltransferase family 4 protein [Methylocella sp.]
MRVVHVTAARRPGFDHGVVLGGLERFLQELIPAEQALGLDVGVLEISLEALAASSDAVSQYDWGKVSAIGREVLGTFRADVFHFHDWYGGVVLEFLYRQGIRSLVVSSHLPLRRGFTYRDVGLSWEAKSLVENRCLQAAPYITVPSSYAKHFLINEYGLFAERISVIQHGVNGSTFYPRRRSFAEEAPRLIAVGRFTDQKGFELLVRAFKLILSVEPDARLTIVGHGEKRDGLCHLINDLNLNKSVAVLDGKSKIELASLYSDSTLLIIPSQFEPFGLVGLEAMACGCPVLAIAPTGASEYLTAEELTNAYSIRQLAEAICSRILVLREQTASRHLVQLRTKEWTWQRAAIAYRELYNRCLV